MDVISHEQCYEIIKLKDSNFTALVVQTACCPPSKLLSKISEDLSSERINGLIIIDCLLYSGNNNERFVSAFFSENSFDLNSIKYENIERDSYIRKLTCEFLRKHNKIVEYSILNSYQKKLVAFGCNI